MFRIEKSKKLKLKISKKTISINLFRSSDLRVMSPARFLCAMMLFLYGLS